jgi:hypothetical protein
MSQEIAQIVWPSDGHGTQLSQGFSGTTIDWSHGRVFLWNGTYIRGYDISTFGTYSPYATAAWPRGVLSTVCGVRVTWDGYILVCTSGYSGISKLDPLTLAEVGRFGAAGGSYPTSIGQLSNAYDSAMGVCEVNGVGYLLGRELVFGSGGLIRTDNMTAAGFYQTLSGGWFGNGMVCGGKSGADSGSIYCIDAYDNVANPAQVNLYKIVIEAGAETYNISSWPTQNPHVSYSLLTQVTGAMVDPSWTTIETQSIGYDAANNIILLAMTTYAGSDIRLVGLDGDTGAVIWSINPFGGRNWTADLSQSRVQTGYLSLVANGNLFSPRDAPFIGIKTLTGETVLSGNVYGIGTIFRAFSSDDVTEGWLGCVNYDSTVANSPTAESGTASNFSGQCMIRPLLPIYATLAFDDLQVTQYDPPPGEHKVWLRWSDDRGMSWSEPVLQELGSQAEYDRIATWLRTGTSRDRVIELSWSIDAMSALTGVWVDVTLAPS